MFDQFLKLMDGTPTVETAVSLGVDNSYISKLRSGWRPTRVRKDLWQRLVAHVAGAARRATEVREGPGGYRGETHEYFRGQQDTLMDMMRWVVDQQADIGRYLRDPAKSGDSRLSYEEVEAADAILDSMSPPRARKPEKPKKRA